MSDKIGLQRSNPARPERRKGHIDVMSAVGGEGATTDHDGACSLILYVLSVDGTRADHLRRSR